ncbi:NlpC/P60 family protein [Shumkonia mesophila]|uniref:hypothetical protein n=1 Tax=Shumkonia mesophila TaxID=2838854 RepID=UPI0029351C25|nr:hypothetical protein [Shumkonia mesophila]
MARPRLSPLNRPPVWADAYVGLPWDDKGRTREGLDCWGLYRLIKAERFGVVHPLYEGVVWTPCETRAGQAEANRDLAAYMEGERLKGWTTVWEALGAPPDEPLGGKLALAGDLVWIRNVGAAIHVGLVAAPGWMLHVEEGIDSVCVPYDGADFERRVRGFYRWTGGDR